MMLVVVPSAALWAAGGGVLSRLIASERSSRIVSLVMAALIAATVIGVWV